MKIVITLEVPDGTTVVTASGSAAEPSYVPPFADELIPLPDSVIPLPDDASARQVYAQAVNTPPGFAEGAAIATPTPFRGAATGVPDALCPVHNAPWTLRPAGVAKATGKPYGPFWACSAPGRCPQRPAASFLATHPAA